MSFRKEKKLNVSVAEMNLLKNELSQRGLTKLYESRTITSVYFDTKDLQMYYESEEGVLPREKIRIRWYDNNQSKFLLERKISSLEGRYKTSKKITPQDRAFLYQSGIHSHNYGHLHGVMQVRYDRSYFTYKNVRVTFDENIIYQSVKSAVKIRDTECVMEVKAPHEYTDDDFLAQFGISERRFSKYARSCQLTKYSLI
jgi:hypothetical protein